MSGVMVMNALLGFLTLMIVEFYCAWYLYICPTNLENQTKDDKFSFDLLHLIQHSRWFKRVNHPQSWPGGPCQQLCLPLRIFSSDSWESLRLLCLFHFQADNLDKWSNLWEVVVCCVCNFHRSESREKNPRKMARRRHRRTVTKGKNHKKEKFLWEKWFQGIGSPLEDENFKRGELF